MAHELAHASLVTQWRRAPYNDLLELYAREEAPHFLASASQLLGSMRTISNLENARDNFSLAANKKRCISTA